MVNEDNETYSSITSPTTATASISTFAPYKEQNNNQSEPVENRQ